MSDTRVAEIRVGQAAEGRKIEIALHQTLVGRLAMGGSAQLSFGDSMVDFDDPLTTSNAELDGHRVGITEVTLTLLRT